MESTDPKSHSKGTGCTSSRQTFQVAQAVHLVNQPFNWPKYTASQPTLQLPQSTLQLAQIVRPANQSFNWHKLYVQSINPSTGTSYTSSQSTFQLAQAVRRVNQPFNWHKLYVQSISHSTGTNNPSTGPINPSTGTSCTSNQSTFQVAQAVRRVNQPFNLHKLYVESTNPSTCTSCTSSQSTLQLAQAIRPVDQPFNWYDQPFNWHNQPFNWHKLYVQSNNPSTGTINPSTGTSCTSSQSTTQLQRDKTQLQQDQQRKTEGHASPPLSLTERAHAKTNTAHNTQIPHLAHGIPSPFRTVRCHTAFLRRQSYCWGRQTRPERLGRSSFIQRIVQAQCRSSCLRTARQTAV